jgi:hypothetical protein
MHERRELLKYDIPSSLVVETSDIHKNSFKTSEAVKLKTTKITCFNQKWKATQSSWQDCRSNKLYNITAEKHMKEW